MDNVTLRDIAREAGVAASTVSYALSGKATLNDETRQRILQVADRLGYKPRAAKQSAPGEGSTPIIAILIGGGPGQPPLDYHFLGEILRGATEAAQDFGFLITVLYEKTRNPLFDFAALCRNGTVKGLLVTGQHRYDEVLESLIAEGFPTVLMMKPSQAGSPVSSISIDDEQSAFQATEHLIILGHTRIAMLLPGSTDLMFSSARYAGYHRALDTYGIPFDKDLVVDGGLLENLSEEAMGRLLALPNPPSALFSGNDTQAIGAMRAARKRNLVIPDDLALIGFDDSMAARFCVPSLTTMHVPEYRMSSEGTRMLIRKILRPGIGPESIVIPAELVIRETCGVRSERHFPGSSNRTQADE